MENKRVNKQNKTKPKKILTACTRMMVQVTWFLNLSWAYLDSKRRAISVLAFLYKRNVCDYDLSFFTAPVERTGKVHLFWRGRKTDQKPAGSIPLPPPAGKDCWPQMGFQPLELHKQTVYPYHTMVIVWRGLDRFWLERQRRGVLSWGSGR